MEDVETQVKRHFDEISDSYYRIVHATPFLYGYYHHKEISILTRAFRAFLARGTGSENPFVLDIGCASGRVILTISSYAPDAVFIGLDVSTKMIRLAKMNKRANVEYVVGDIRSLPFKDRAFDFVYSLEVIEHLNNKQTSIPMAVSDVLRTTKPSGCILLESTSVNHFLLHAIARRAFPGATASFLADRSLENYRQVYERAPLLVAAPSSANIVKNLLRRNGARVNRVFWIRVVPEQLFVIVKNRGIRKLLTAADEILSRLPILHQFGREFIIQSLKNESEVSAEFLQGGLTDATSPVFPDMSRS